MLFVDKFLISAPPVERIAKGRLRCSIEGHGTATAAEQEPEEKGPAHECSYDTHRHLGRCHNNAGRSVAYNQIGSAGQKRCPPIARPTSNKAITIPPISGKINVIPPTRSPSTGIRRNTPATASRIMMMTMNASGMHGASTKPSKRCRRP